VAHEAYLTGAEWKLGNVLPALVRTSCGPKHSEHGPRCLKEGVVNFLLSDEGGARLRVSRR